MSLGPLLEDFGAVGGAASGNAAARTADEIENSELDAFDKGYRAGWDDAIKAKEDDGVHIAGDFAQTLQDLSFSYHEAHAQVLTNLAPLFEEIFDKLLPRIARDTLGAHLAEQLASIARDIGTAEVEIGVAPGRAETVAEFVDGAACGFPVHVVENASIGEAQAEIRFADRELSVDLAEVTSQISEAVRAVLQEPQGRAAHG